MACSCHSDYSLHTVNCRWLEWSEWSPCTVSCGFGLSSRNRTKIEAQHGGLACVGRNKEWQFCNTHECPGLCRKYSPHNCTSISSSSLFTDPCKDNQCFEGVQCIAINDTAYTCGSCPPGRSGDGYNCAEINEVNF